MNGCSAMQAKFSEYLDGRLNGREMQQIAAHLERCRECAAEWDSLREAQASLADLGPVPEPKDLSSAHSRGRQPGARAQPQEHLSCLEPGLEEHGGTVPAAGFGRICQRGAAAGHGDSVW